jgi:hypothetical protein
MKLPPLRLDLRAMGWNLSFPLVAHLAVVLHLYFSGGGRVGQLPGETIQTAVGLVSPLLVTFWVSALYQDLVESDGKEALLALPYNSFALGVLRVLRTAFFYFLFVWGVIRLLFLFSPAPGASPLAWLVLATSIFFFSALAFFAVVLTRRLVYTYLLVAVFSVGEWARIYLASLRFGLQTLPAGGGAAAFNPFQLAQPAPGADPLVVSFILFIAAVFLLSCGQMLFTRRGYLLK